MFSLSIKKAVFVLSFEHHIVYLLNLGAYLKFNTDFNIACHECCLVIEESLRFKINIFSYVIVQ